MGNINILDKHISELIAAGEVVERPSSVVKELIENSIDANAKSIEVEIKNGGTSLIRITDDGQGILREDVPKAFLRHATSKVKNADDLDKIMTLGFRGEALASIAAVSRVDMITKTESELAGTHYQIEGSEEVLIEDTGCPKGTTIFIKDLFYNTPARMKFLKKDVSEANAVAAIVDRVAMSHPDISFKFIKNSKEELNTPGDGNIKSCIYSIYGKSFCNGLIPVKYEMNCVKVNGFTSDTNSARPNRSMQHFFINGRYVKSKTMMVALEQAFKGSIMVGKFPSCVLYLEIPSEIVDVNVHPAKIEVRFIDEKPIFDVVYHGVKTAIRLSDNQIEMPLNNSQNKEPVNINKIIKTHSIIEDKKIESIPTENTKEIEPSVFIPKKVTQYSSLVVKDSVDLQKRYQGQSKKEVSSDVTLHNKKENFVTTALKDNHLNYNFEEKENILGAISDNILSNKRQEIKKENNENKINTFFSVQDNNEVHIVGEVFNTYIILEEGKDKLLLVDKHAAHERLIYEKLKKESGKSFSQYLLSPITVTLEKNEYSAVISNLKLFREAGFEIDDFGLGTVIVRSAPLYLEHGDISDSIIEMAGYILDNKSEINTEYVDWLYHNIACRSAIKAGDKNSNDELLILVKKLEENPDLRHCPHGRPILISITKKEIEKQFGRVWYKMIDKSIPIVVVVGPTASGKTDFAVNIAKKYDGEIVSADSMQIYKQMNIGSAKPSKEEMQGIPHHLIGFLDISEEFSVADYVKMAHSCVMDIYSRNKLPIVCGGTGLYVSSLIDNIQFEDSNVDKSLREKLNKKAEIYGIESLLEELKEFDLPSYHRLAPTKNARRIIRAIEIYKSTGITMTEQIKRSKSLASPYNPQIIGLNFIKREDLYKRINNRVDKMIEKGLVYEAEKILKTTCSKTSMSAIGYKEFIPHFKGESSLDECIEKIKINTRHYAKRQITWFKRDKRISWILRNGNEKEIDFSIEV